MTTPKLFISYCWSSPEHEEWVLNLGVELRNSGVDVILDKWDLKEGHDANAFMEKMVSDPEITKVILVIDEQYGDKANRRDGGVGTEAQIISAKVYESVEQTKFVAVIASKNMEGKANVPVYYQSRIHIDLSDEALYSKNFEQLLRWIYDKPLNVKPELGSKPSFLDDDSLVTLGTSVAFRRLVDGLKTSKSYVYGAMTEYFDLFSRGLEKFRLEPSAGASDFDEKVFASIDQFHQYKNELTEVFIAIAQYDSTENSAPIIHKFFESLGPYFNPPTNVSSYAEWDFDNFKFIIHESFLLCVAVLLKFERFSTLEHLLKRRYYVERDAYSSESTMHSFVYFLKQITSLERRNMRLQLNRKSVQADILNSRYAHSPITFQQVMQADFTLYLIDSLQSIREKRRQMWWPITLVYCGWRSSAFEIYLRAESTEYFKKIAAIFGVNDKSDLIAFIEALKSKDVYPPEQNVSASSLMNFENLCLHV